MLVWSTESLGQSAFQKIITEASAWEPEPQPEGGSLFTTVNPDLYRSLTSEPDPEPVIAPDTVVLPVGPTATPVAAEPPPQPIIEAVAVEESAPTEVPSAPPQTIAVPIGPTAPSEPEPIAPPPTAPAPVMTAMPVPGEGALDPYAPVPIEPEPPKKPLPKWPFIVGGVAAILGVSYILVRR
jgi:hypothetical protein